MNNPTTAADVLIAALTTHGLGAGIDETGGGCTAVTVPHPGGQVIVADGFSARHLPEDHDAWAATPEVLDDDGGVLEQLPSIHAPEPPVASCETDSASCAAAIAAWLRAS